MVAFLGLLPRKAFLFLGLRGCVNVLWIVSLYKYCCFRNEQRANVRQTHRYIVRSRVASVMLLFLSGLGAESLVSAPSLPHLTALSPRPSTALSLRAIRMTSGPEIGGRAEAAVGAPSIKNEGRVTAEVLDVQSVHSSQVNIAPPQFFTRVRLRLLTVGNTPGTPSFLTGGEGTVLEAYTREPVDPTLIGKQIQCTLRYRGDERGGLYWAYEIRALPGTS